MTEQPPDVIVAAGRLRELTARILGGVGMAPHDATLAADVLVSADARGVSSHGVARVAPFYVPRIRAGDVNCAPKIARIAESAATAVIDGDDFLLGGALLPLGGDADRGGYKGFGLALAVDLLSSALSGGHASINLERGANHFFGALSIPAFVEPGTFQARTGAMIEALKASPRVPGVDEITYAGEHEERLARAHESDGIPLHWSVALSLKVVSEQVGFDSGLPDPLAGATSKP